MYNNPFDDFESPERYGSPIPGRPFPGGPPPPAGGFGPPIPPPGQFPMGGQQQPPGPPPRFIPSFPTTQTFAGGISRCLFRNTYVWLRNGRTFWFYPITVTRDTIIGFRWSNRRGWLFRSIRRDNILTFTCFI